MKTKWILGFSILTLVTHSQSMASSLEIQEVCNTVEECRALKAKAESRLADLFKNIVPEMTEILGKGKTRYRAGLTCESKNLRLPTARELALVAYSYGANGISETPKKGYYLVKGSDSTGNPDHFYYSHEGYQRPAGDYGKFDFWSSSVFPDAYSKHENSYNRTYMLNGANGYIYDAYNSSGYYIQAVRCVSSSR